MADRRTIRPYLPEDEPEVIRVWKPAGESAAFGVGWHTDNSFFERPSLATCLHAITVPPYGGDTLFASMEHAYRALSDTMKGWIDDTAEDDVPFALDRLEHGSASERVVAAWALGAIRHAGAEPKLREALDDKDANVRSNALGALLELGPADWVDLLARGLADKDPFVQQSTLSQMPDLTPRVLIEPISALLVESDDEPVRIGAADALGEARGAGVAEALAHGAADAVMLTDILTQ